MLERVPSGVVGVRSCPRSDPRPQRRRGGVLGRRPATPADPEGEPGTRSRDASTSGFQR